MGWAVGYDERWKRDIGYGVPAFCDHPGCCKQIDRGLSRVCGGEPYGGERGCGLYFCSSHLLPSARLPQLCARCIKRRKPFSKTMDSVTWMRHKLTDESWKEWREENPCEVELLKSRTPL